MARARPVLVLVTYRPRPGQASKFSRLLVKHFPALKRARLVVPDSIRTWKARDKRTGRNFYVESFA